MSNYNGQDLFSTRVDIQRLRMGWEVSESTNIDWVYQNKLREQWLIDNPDSQYIGWMSI